MHKASVFGTLSVVVCGQACWLVAGRTHELANRRDLHHRDPTRSAGSHISQSFDLLQFLGHQKNILQKTCMCAVKFVLHFMLILQSFDSELFGPALI